MHGPRRTTQAALLAFALALSGLFALPIQSYAAGTIVYVDASASGTGDGSSWADAYPSLADALAGAASGTEIWVAKGTYKPTSGTDRNPTSNSRTAWRSTAASRAARRSATGATGRPTSPRSAAT